MKITIEAGPGEGKTTISMLIAHALRSAGFGVYEGDSDVKHATHNPGLQAKRIEAMVAKDVLIDIETVQIRKATR